MKDPEILHDEVVTYKGEKKINDWKGKKLNNMDVADSLRRVYENTDKAERYIKVFHCAMYMDFKKYFEDEIEKLKLHKAFFCKDRLCPMCAWRRSLKIYAQASAVMTEAVAMGYRFVFLTLTVKNVKSDNLDNTIQEMMRGFGKLRRRTAFTKAFHGFFRALEITYNRKTDEYHPHFHIILAVKKSYFRSKFYLEQSTIAQMWKESMNLDYTPIVDIRNFKAATKKELAKSTAEVAKYTVKDSDYLIRDGQGNIDEERTDKVVYTLAEALFNKRLIAWGGILKEIHKKLNLDDAEDGNLIITDQEDEPGGAFIIVRYRWGVGVASGELNYYLSEEVIES